MNLVTGLRTFIKIKSDWMLIIGETECEWDGECMEILCPFHSNLFCFVS
jgi:hypothetical protein